MASAIIISALLPVIFEKTATFIEEKLGVVLGADLGKELSRLRRTLLTIQAVLDDAEEKQGTDKALALWLSNLKDATYDADNILDDFNLNALDGNLVEPDQLSRRRIVVGKISRFFTCAKNPILFRGRMVSEIRDMTERFDSLAKERSDFHLREVAPAVDLRSPSQSFIMETEVVGRSTDVKQIVEKLNAPKLDDGISVLPITGMGGLGKTTLAQMVFNHPSVISHFELRVWSVVTHDFSAAKIAKDMIQTVTESGFGLTDLDSLQRNLRKFVGTKRYLLVLDDVWSEDPLRWEEVKVMLTFGAKGSSVVMTTRSGKASSIMGTMGTHWLDQLSEDECWALFSRRAFAGGMVQKPNLVALGRAIVKKSGMLPLAAKALGGLMHQQTDEKEWKAVLDSEIWDDKLHGGGVLPALRLSYHHLPPQLKQCFGFCALFPRGYGIEKETLIKLWMGNGFILSSGKPTAVELRGQEIFRGLEQRSFFQDVKETEYDGKRVTTCRMHDLINDLARTIMGDQCCILDDKWDRNNTVAGDPRTRYIFDAASTPAAAAVLASKSLRTLLFSGKRPDGVNIAQWSGAKYLRVLGLHDTGLKEFPVSVCDFRHLRYLDLSGNDIEALPEDISKLLGLQTLNLSGCGKLLGLPKSMRQMSGLMYLYLDGCGSLRNMPAGMGKLRCLRTLTRYVAAGEESESGSIGELKDLNLHGALELYNLKNVGNVTEAEEANLGSKENLERLDFDWGEAEHEPGEAEAAGIAEEQVLRALQPHPNLKHLGVRRYRGPGYPDWFKAGYLSNLVEVVLADCGARCESLPQFWGLPYLESLEIGGVECIKRIGGGDFYGMTAVGKAFPFLKHLKLYQMPNLEEWSVLEGRPAFPCVAKIEIADCPKLTTMPAVASAISLTIKNCPLLRPAAVDGFFGRMKALEWLELDSCDGVASMLEEEEGPGGPLQYLCLRNSEFPMFSKASSVGLWSQFSSLQNLEIRSCSGLSCLPVEVFRGLPSLKRISMHYCDNLLAVEGGEEMNFFQYCNNMFLNWEGEGEEEEGEEEEEERGAGEKEEEEEERGEGEGEEEEEEEERGEGEKEGEESQGLKFEELPALEELDIQICTGFRRFHPEGLKHLPSLKNLSIYSNHGLTELPDFSDSVRNVTIYNCWRLVSLPVGLGRLPSLERFVLLSCNYVESIPEEENGYMALKTLKIEDCPSLTLLPLGLQRRLPSLNSLEIKSVPELEKRCMPGGEYWNLVSCIPIKYIGG